MLEFPAVIQVPLVMNEANGQIWFSGKRVPLELVISLFHQGYSPERIAQGINVLPLRDVYAAIAYYLSNQKEVDEYIKKIEAEIEEVRNLWQSGWLPTTKAKAPDWHEFIEQTSGSLADDPTPIEDEK